MSRLVVRTCVALAIPFLFICCATRPNSDFIFLGQFQKGVTRGYVDSVKNETPKFSYDLPADGTMKLTHVDVYPMILRSVTPGYLSFFTYAPNDRYDLLAFAYQNDRLVYCGTVDDFKKCTNVELLSISTKLNDELLKEY